jgi:hypothetical protein
MRSHFQTPDQAIQYLQDRLKMFRKERLKVTLTQGSILSVSLFLFLFILLIPLGTLFNLSPLLYQTSILIFFLALLWFVGKPLLYAASLVRLAVEVEKHHSHLKGRLVSALQFWGSRKGFGREGYSSELIEGTCLKAAELVENLDLTPLIDRRGLHRSSRLGSRILLLLFAFAAFLPGPFYSSISGFSTGSSGIGKTLLKVSPGDVEIPRGSSLTIEARTFGEKPSEVFVIRDSGFERTMAPREERLAGRWRLEIPRVEKGFEYEVFARSPKHETRSTVFQVRVYDPPEVSQLRLKYVYPSYTHLDPLEVEGGGDITGLIGTKVLLNGRANNSLTQANLLIFSKENSEWRTVNIELKNPESQIPNQGTPDSGGSSFTGSLVIRGDGEYKISLLDRFDRENDPILHRITAIPDERPSVRILEPGRDVDIKKSMILPLRISFADDFGLTKAYLVFKSANRDQETEASRLEIANYKGRVGTDELVYDWDLIPITLLPGDLLSYWVEVYDNDTYSGPKRATSSVFHLRYPTLEEIYREVAMEQGEMVEGIEERILPAQEKLQEQLDRLSQEILTQKNFSWEEEKSLESAVERQKEIAKDLRNLAESVEQRLNEMQEGLVVDRETMEMMQEIGRLMREVETEEMREALRRLEEAMQSLKPEEIKEAMKQLTLNQEELKKRLERTLEVLKRMKQEQEMKALVEKAKEIEERQEQINEETEGGSEEGLDQQAKEQEALQKEVEALKERMEKLAQELEASDPEVSEALESLSEEMMMGDLSGKMGEANQQLSKGNRPKGLQKDISGQLSRLSQGLQSAQEKMQSMRQEEVLQAIRKAQEDLLTLSTGEEDLTTQIEGTAQAGTDPFDLAETQQALSEGVKRVADELYETSQKSFFIPPEVGRSLGKSLNMMSATSEGLQSSRIRQAESTAGEAMASLNETVKNLMDAYNAACQSPSSTGLEEAMQQMSACSAGQQQINQGTQGMLPLDMQGGQLSMEARSQMSRLAAEQQALSERLQGVSEGIGDRSDILGDLENLVEEMKEIAQELEERRVNENLVERQKRILSRLLDAQRSLHQRDYSQKRKAEVGEENPNLIGPSGLPQNLGERRKALREDLLKALQEGYPAEYEALIKAYFRSLSESPQPIE